MPQKYLQVGTAAHELSHTLGVFHSQMRSDRDEYVTIDLTDVPEASQPNFYKMTAATSTNLVDYEYGSFMHYGGRACVFFIVFSKRFLKNMHNKSRF